jgi:hypothetical protein
MNKKILLLTILALAISAKAQPRTNVILGWNDTNNFRMGLVRQSDGAILIPATTQMIYHVFASTNLLTPLKSWGIITNVTSINPGTNLITAVVSAKEVAQFFTVTAQDPYTGLESDFSNWLGLSPIPASVRTGIFPFNEGN